MFAHRSEGRRVGREGRRWCRSRGSPHQEKQAVSRCHPTPPTPDGALGRGRRLAQSGRLLPLPIRGPSKPGTGGVRQGPRATESHPRPGRELARHPSQQGSWPNGPDQRLAPLEFGSGLSHSRPLGPLRKAGLKEVRDVPILPAGPGPQRTLEMISTHDQEGSYQWNHRPRWLLSG